MPRCRPSSARRWASATRSSACRSASRISTTSSPISTKRWNSGAGRRAGRANVKLRNVWRTNAIGNHMLTQIREFVRRWRRPAARMFLIIGSVVVIACVIGGYVLNGGHLAVLFQPFEILIIVGAAVGAFITSNRKPVLSATITAITGLLKAERYDKEAYLELL